MSPDYYNGTCFHRNMQGLMVQGGDPTVRIQIAWKLLNFLLLLLSQLIWFGPFHISFMSIDKGHRKRWGINLGEPFDNEFHPGGFKK